MDKPAILSNPEAFAVVPVVPTPAMIKAALDVNSPIPAGLDSREADNFVTALEFAASLSARPNPTALSDIAAYCAELEAENKQWKRYTLDASQRANFYQEELSHIQEQAAKLEARLAEAERVIAPFASMAKGYEDASDYHVLVTPEIKNPSDVYVFDFFANAQITVEDLRAARTWGEEANA